MMNIEQLAIEHGFKQEQAGYNIETKKSAPYITYSFTLMQLEAFAKAYAQQQSKPVGFVIITPMGLFNDVSVIWINKYKPKDGENLFTQPPNTVSLEQYNKLLGKIAELEADLLACSNENIALRDAIAEAERSDK